jgi:Peptidase family S41
MATLSPSRRAAGGSGEGKGDDVATPTLDTGLTEQFLANTPEPVREHLSASVDLREFLQGAGILTLDERRLLVDQALLLLDQNYVHLPLKVAMHAVNPLQRLRLLRARLERQTASTMDPEWRFHAEMSAIFHSVRDLHTNYLLPMPFAGKVAYLPFQVEEYFEGEERRYVVSRLVQGYSAPGFAPGVEVTYWNGIPIATAVELNAARFAGSNAAARRSRGVESLTIRPLRIHLPPDEQWVTVGYVDSEDEERELREKWLVADNLPSLVPDPDDVSATTVSLGLDLGAEEASLARKLLYAPHVVEQEATGEMPVTRAPVAEGADLPTSMPGVFRARSVSTSSGTFGHIRIFTFSVNDPSEFVNEFVRLVRLLPQNGLIVDVRGNGGGHIYASEFTLQTLTPRHIVPEPVQFINTPLNLRICRKHKDNPTNQIDLGPWYRSIEQSVETGATFSHSFSITPEDGANEIGQIYTGPVILVTDARCYSATDIFAAGFKDHVIGPVLGVDENTGAGGANVWTQGLLKNLLELPTPDEDSPYRALPKGANMRVSIRRTLRVGAESGTPVEDLGVVPDERHFMTRDDVLEGNVDLLNRAGELLAALPVRRLDVTASPSGSDDLDIEVEVANVDRVDVYVDGRPRASLDPAGGSASVTVTGVPGASSVEVEGFDGDELVAARRVVVG